MNIMYSLISYKEFMTPFREFSGHRTALELFDTLPPDVNLAVNVHRLEPRKFLAPPMARGPRPAQTLQPAIEAD
jgi:hypothetical protein